MVQLRAGHRVASAGPGERDVVCGPDGVARSKLIRVEPNSIAHASCVRAAVPQVHRDHAIGLARHDPDRPSHRPPVCRDIDHVLIGDSETDSRSRAQLNRVVPRDLAERLGQFLKPARIGEAAVIHSGIWPEHQFQAGGRRRL